MSVVLDLDLIIMNAIHVQILSTCNHLWTHHKNASQPVRQGTIQTQLHLHEMTVAKVAIDVLDQMILTELNVWDVGSLMKKMSVSVRTVSFQNCKVNGFVNGVQMNDLLALKRPMITVFSEMTIITYNPKLIRLLAAGQTALKSTMEMVQIISVSPVPLNVKFAMVLSIQIARTEPKTTSSSNPY